MMSSSCTCGATELPTKKKNVHTCICKSIYQGHKYCKAEEEDHECICQSLNSKLCRKKLTLKHYCTCNTRYRCKSNDDHFCICHFRGEHIKNCRSTEGNHHCTCQFSFGWNDILEANTDSCRRAEGDHKSICICVLGIEFMRICPAITFHSCQCALLNRCRKHSSFDIWNEWETNSNSYLYWIPEEVLKDCLLFIFVDAKEQA
jgi:hypothetical protein